MPITFAVDSVEGYNFTTHHPHSDKDIERYLQRDLTKLGVKKAEAHKFNLPDVALLPPTRNAFVMTALDAFKEHRPITFSPDDIWLVVAQAVTQYIAQNSEEARKAIVSFEGKKTLTVVNTDFVKGSHENPWEREFAKFSDQIAEHLGKRRDLFDPLFTTTGPTEKAAIQVQMMAALAPYFSYKMMTMCGVPTITLLGEVSDWEALHNRVLAFAEFLPPWVLVPLHFATNHFLAAAKGQPDLDFWQNFFKTRGGSGGTPVGGFINCFFPYVDGNEQNQTILGDFKSNIITPTAKKSSLGPTNDVGDFGSSMGSVPMLWDYYGEQIKMRLASGIVGSTLIDGSYRCVIGWIVGQDDLKSEK